MKSTFNFSYFATLYLLVGCVPLSWATIPSDLPSSHLSLSTTLLPSLTNQSCPVWMANCQGQKKYPDGSIYHGEFKFGKPHGQGIMTWKDGSQYKGSFKNGERHGQGEYIFPNGNRYDGEWLSGYMEGEGAFTWHCGHEYIGTFRQDKMDGEGSILMANGASYSGTWKAGLADGFGEFLRMDGSLYIGQCSKGEKDGQGEIIFPTGDTLYGNWTAGNLDGNITFKFSNGDQMISSWDNGEKLHGMIYQSGEGKTYPGTYQQIEDALTMEDFDRLIDFEKNMQMGLYSFGVELKTNNRFEEATALFRRCREISHHNAPLLTLITIQMKEIKSTQSDSGWAQLDNQ